jgi:serine/threonine protein kinase
MREEEKEMMHNYRDWRDDFQKVYSHSIGQGTFGRVCLVKCKQTQKYYAMKEINLKQHILKSSLINRSYALDEGLKLIRLGLEHDNLIRYHRSYIHDDCIYWVMDYCDGGTLRERISLYIKQGKHMDENLIWYWSLHILAGIRYIHSRGLIHRDLKPDNIYISGKQGVCKLGDFGFAKLMVESSITDNTTTVLLSPLRDLNGAESSDTEEQPQQQRTSLSSRYLNDEKIVYKLINMSQVGTPSYIAPEIRMLIDSHLNFSSIATINERVKICERHIYKGDIFSFGCILYEMTFLKLAFENKFQLPSEVYARTSMEIETSEAYSADLKSLIKLCLEKSPEDRPSVNRLFRLSLIDSRLKQDYLDYYKRQVIPSLSINSKKNVLLCINAQLEANYKPIAMRSLKFNQNLIVILAIKQNYKVKKTFSKLLPSSLNTFTPFGLATASAQQGGENEIIYASDQADHDCGGRGGLGVGSNDPDESDYYFYEEDVPKLFVYNEYGQLVHEFNSFYDTSQANRKLFTFNIYDFCVDEEFDHLYMSTRKYGILRFQIVDKSHYLEDLVFDGCLNLNELSEQQHRLFPTCLTLVEDESLFKDTVKVTRRRRLIFYDRISKRIISAQVDLFKADPLLAPSSSSSSNMIKCYINAGLTLDQQYIRQMVSTSKELICLFDDLNLINVYNLKTLQLVRSNVKTTPPTTSTTTTSSLKKQTMCLTLDSDGSLYSTKAKSIFNLDYFDFKQKKRINPFVKKGEILSHTICWMTILTNSKLVLLTDALQMENSILFILKPVNNSILNNATNTAHFNNNKE